MSTSNPFEPPAHCHIVLGGVHVPEESGGLSGSPCLLSGIYPGETNSTIRKLSGLEFWHLTKRILRKTYLGTVWGYLGGCLVMFCTCVVTISYDFLGPGGIPTSLYEVHLVWFYICLVIIWPDLMGPNFVRHVYLCLQNEVPHINNIRKISGIYPETSG